jgi:dipeptidyl aminopeptidase/acylaminoacyl peptidase
MKKLIFLILTIFLTFSCQKPPLMKEFPVSECAKSEQTQQEIQIENEAIKLHSIETAKLYELDPNETLKDISQKVLENSNTSEGVKKAILGAKRQYYLFSYPSDGLKIKGYLSVPTNHEGPLPLLIVLRGGNRMFGLPHPRELSLQPGYALITTTYRGGVSEGTDEFGGADVNDVKNLMDFIPTLSSQTGIAFDPQRNYMIGLSRGGMQLFLALGRYPALQKQIKKAISISGLLNIETSVADRPDFAKMLQTDFGLPKGEGAKDWLAKRQPLTMAAKISPKLPIMIAQGTVDTRVCIKEGYDMLSALHAAGHEATYVEIEGGDHVLLNSPDFLPVMMQWLEQ